MRKLKTLLLALVILLIPLQVQAKTPKFDYSDKYIAVGQTIRFDMLNTKKKVKWSVSNKKVSITKKGKKYIKVKGKKVGSVYIKGKIGKKTYKKKLTVFNPTLNTTSAELFVGDDLYLNLYGKDDKFYQSYSSLPIKWKSSDNNIVTVNEYGECQAVGAGTCTITATLYKKTYQCTITSKETYVTKDAKANTSFEKINTTNGYVIKITNNYMYPSCYKTIYTFTNNGKAVHNDYTYLYIDANSTIYWYVSNKNNSDKQFNYDDISISLEPEYEDYYAMAEKNITLEKQYGDNEVMALYNNPNSESIDIRIVFVFYKDGKPIYADYDSNITGGNSKGIIKVSYPYYYNSDDDLVYIDFDDFDVFIEQAYISK